MKASGLICRGILDVRPAAQVHEGIVLIDGDLRLLLERVAVLVQAALLEPVDQLQLVGLVLEDLARFVGGHDLLHELEFAGDDLPHALLDLPAGLRA